MYLPNLKFVALPVPEIAIAVLGCGYTNLQSWGRSGRRVGDGRPTIRNSVGALII